MFHLIAGSPDRVGFHVTKVHRDIAPNSLDLETVISFLKSRHVRATKLWEIIDRRLTEDIDEESINQESIDEASTDEERIDQSLSPK